MDDLDKAIYAYLREKRGYTDAYLAQHVKDHAQAQRAVLAIRDWRALGWWKRVWEWVRG